jgi:coproporphyrinogen III oxidase-like Fe-S oxidoreductase
LDMEYLQLVYDYQLTEKQEATLEHMVDHKWLRKEGACYRITSTGFSISDRLGLDLIS